MIAFSGVRISWLMLARNCDFVRLAFSASLRAVSRACSKTLPFGHVDYMRDIIGNDARIIGKPGTS